MLLYILAVGEFWLAMILAIAVKEWYDVNAPMVLFVPVFWLLIHFGIPALFGKKPLW